MLSGTEVSHLPLSQVPAINFDTRMFARSRARFGTYEATRTTTDENKGYVHAARRLD